MDYDDSLSSIFNGQLWRVVTLEVYILKYHQE